MLSVRDCWRLLGPPSHLSLIIHLNTAVCASGVSVIFQLRRKTIRCVESGIRMRAVGSEPQPVDCRGSRSHHSKRNVGTKDIKRGPAPLAGGRGDGGDGQGVSWITTPVTGHREQREFAAVTRPRRRASQQLSGSVRTPLCHPTRPSRPLSMAPSSWSLARFAKHAPYPFTGSWYLVIFFH